MVFTEEKEPSELESTMRSTLIVTCVENTNKYSMDLNFDGLRYSIHFAKTHNGREEGVVINFLKEDLYAWISKDPMSNPVGMYGICFYAHEARNCPKWVRKFANCFA